jgi:hypothetical protein
MISAPTLSQGHSGTGFVCSFLDGTPAQKVYIATRINRCAVKYPANKPL